jgi:hypothetical protein
MDDIGSLDDHRGPSTYVDYCIHNSYQTLRDVFRSLFNICLYGVHS